MRRRPRRPTQSRAVAPSFGGSVAVVMAIGVMVILAAAAVLGAVSGGENPAAAERCVRWYPDYCVPADRGALDCDDIRSTPLRVKGADPFDFDGDLDGTGCESG